MEKVFLNEAQLKAFVGKGVFITDETGHPVGFTNADHCAPMLDFQFIREKGKDVRGTLNVLAEYLDAPRDEPISAEELRRMRWLLKECAGRLPRS